MKLLNKYIVLCSTLLAFMAVFSSCKEQNNTPDNKPNQPMSVEQKEVTLEKNQIFDLKVIGGSGQFTVSLPQAGVATAEVREDLIHLHAKQEGDQIMTLTDKKTDQKIEIKLSVVDKALLKVDLGNPTIFYGAYKVFNVSNGSGSYSCEISNPDLLELVSIDGSRVILKGIGRGTTQVTITDLENGATKELELNVNTRDLRIEMTTLELKFGSSAIIKIASGNGSYTVRIADAEMLEASADESGVAVNAFKKEGTTTLTIVDDATGQEHNIEVSVMPHDLVLQSERVEVGLNQTLALKITEGNGDYEVRVTSGAEFVDAAISGSEVLITSKKVGKAKIEVIDKFTSQKKEVEVSTRELIMKLDITPKTLTLKKGESARITLNDRSQGNFWTLSIDRNDYVTIQNDYYEYPPMSVVVTGIKEGATLIVIKTQAYYGTPEVLAEIPVTVLPE